jgi:hypothetical protein
MPAQALKEVEPSEEQAWEQRLTAAVRAGDQSQWDIGDLIIEANEKWGEKYTRAMEITDKPEKTLRNYVYVASRVSRRRDNLSFGHHAAIAGRSEAEQEKWLDKAEKGKWTVATLKLKMCDRQPSNGIDPKDRIVVMVPRELIAGFIDAAEARDKPQHDQKKAVAAWLLGLGKRAVAA